MKTCWICSKSYGSLSKEHIIPRMFQGIVTTEEFSCEECNREIGKVEQRLALLGILMANLDNADGEPKITTPKRGSRTKERKMSYGEDPQVELSSTGWLRTETFERPPGKITTWNKIWVPGRIPMEVADQDLHMSMVKAIAAFACHVGFPKSLLGTPLDYLAGNHYVLPECNPRAWECRPETCSLGSAYLLHPKNKL